MERKKNSNLIGNYVLDSSIVIKWFSQEEDTDLALKFREGFIEGKVEIVVPDLQLYEITNALRYNPDISEKEIEEAIQSLIDLDINIVVPIKSVLDLAISIAFEHDISIYDAYFIALAKELNFRFVTADESLYNKIKKLDYVKLLKNFREQSS